MRYDKGHKDASRRRIMEVAGERFRNDGIAASGLAGIMSDAGLTNGAFYPHFKSKAELVRESVAAAMEDQAKLLQDVATDGGLEAAIAAYLSPDHRDNPATGCTLAALLPELARESAETRSVWADHFLATTRQLASDLSPGTPDPDATAIGIYATLIGALQLARVVQGTPLSDRILAAGADAARALVGLERGDH
jgi:TetR/AcrR family transcriptional regulator, transcriptional repressor for nem operon